jgi:hypothetical protein
MVKKEGRIMRNSSRRGREDMDDKKKREQSCCLIMSFPYLVWSENHHSLDPELLKRWV